MASILSCVDDFARVGAALKHGAIAIFPTDTVYGLGTWPQSEKGVRRCYMIKEREANKKMPVLFESQMVVEEYALMNDLASKLAKKFWPGKLTLVLKVANSKFPKLLVGLEKTIAARVPDHECCLRLIEASGGLLIGTSANMSGQPPTVDPNDEELARLANKADFFLKGSCGKSRLPSTIVDLSVASQVKLVREGAIPFESVKHYLAKASSAAFSIRNETTSRESARSGNS